ncbi:hypothetical protein R3P38DRAFT_3433143 [Favolaschia claudopus]|uniref:Uncharacterized protein n=1 Tax=Favolaschia claudopus TaxID=2862362 RepID=A0AAW0D1S1_9AGAR
MEYFYACRNLAYTSPPSDSPLESPIHGVVREEEYIETRVQLLNRLKSGQLSNMPGGFPFQHVVLRGAGQSKRGRGHISHDPFEFRQEFQSSSRCTNSRGNLSAYIAFTQEPAPKTGLPPLFLSWAAYLPKLELYSKHVENHSPYTHAPPPKVPACHVRVHSDVMSTVYGTHIESSPRIILCALANSLELGMLITVRAQRQNDGSGQYNIIYVGTDNKGEEGLLFCAGVYSRR